MLSSSPTQLRRIQIYRLRMDWRIYVVNLFQTARRIQPRVWSGSQYCVGNTPNPLVGLRQWTVHASFFSLRRKHLRGVRRHLPTSDLRGNSSLRPVVRANPCCRYCSAHMFQFQASMLLGHGSSRQSPDVSVHHDSRVAIVFVTRFRFRFIAQ